MWRATLLLGLVAILAIGCDQNATVEPDLGVPGGAVLEADRVLPVQQHLFMAGTQRMELDLDLNSDQVSVVDNVLYAKGVVARSESDVKIDNEIARGSGHGDAYLELDLTTGNGTLRVEEIHTFIWGADLGGFVGTVEITIEAWQIVGKFQREGTGKFERCVMYGSLSGYWGDQTGASGDHSDGPGMMRLEGTVLR